MSVGGALGQSLIGAAPWTEQALLVGAASARFATSFIMLPLFSPQMIPPLVRNSLIITFGLVALSLPVSFDPGALSAGQWLWLFGREAAAGVVIGLFYGTFLWAMASAGEIIDSKTGATIAQIIDPISGGTQSLSATLLGRFAQVTFVTAGGLTLLIGTLMMSYAVWPMGPGGVQLDLAAVTLFEGEFGRYFMIAFILATPALMVLFVIDLGMGLLNRFAQNFNVFMLSLSIKASAAIFVLVLIIPLLGQMVVDELMTRDAVAQGMLDRAGTPR
ncbi:MAG: type III secretion system export apparatus subunit SctT [Pseudomonadota bacterium]